MKFLSTAEKFAPCELFLLSAVQYTAGTASDACSCSDTDPVAMEMQLSPVPAHSIFAFRYHGAQTVQVPVICSNKVISQPEV